MTARVRPPRRAALLFVLAAAASLLVVDIAPARAAQTTLVEPGTMTRYLANTEIPDIGLEWTEEGFDDSLWPVGLYGIGYERIPPGALALLRTTVSSRSFSVYTRARFALDDPGTVTSLFLGADYDDGYVAWINGVEVARSPEMGLDDPAWNTNAASHESSNGATPNYNPLLDITSTALPALHAGVNVLAIGVWNNGAPTSTDLVLVPALILNPDVAVTRGPYLQAGTPTGVVVRWRTGLPTDSRVRYGSGPDDLNLSAGDATLSTEHVVTITGLAPATLYDYSVGSAARTLAGGTADYSFVTPPEPGTPAPTRIWAIGDSGTANAAARSVRDAYSNFAGEARTDLWLMLGDNAYPDGTDAQYQAAVFDMYPRMLRQTVLWPTLGNHDGHTADSATQSGPYFDIFTLPRGGEAGGLPSGTEAYYSFDHANIHFICLDSYETSRSPAGAMMTWLQQDILSTDQDWIIAFWHHPPYSKGSHDSDLDIELTEMRRYALPLLEQGGVDLVLGGHSHSYERSYLLDGHYGLSMTFTEAMKKDGGDGRIDGDGSYKKPTAGPAPHEGSVYVVAGSSGSTGGGALNHRAMYLSFSTLGSLVLDVHGLEMEARFLDDTGAVRDYFTIVKGPVTPPQADFGAEPRAGTVPLEVRFSDRSENGARAWAWDFDGDGAADSRERNPATVYSRAGLYTIGLTAFGAGGRDTEVKTGYVCATSADGQDDADRDGTMDGTDLCPCVADPGQENADGDGRGDACDSCPHDPWDDADGDGFCADADTCPTLSNPDQDPEICRQEVVDIFVEATGRKDGDKDDAEGKSERVIWRSTHEVDLLGFNVVVVRKDGRRRQVNGALIPCQECLTGAGVAYGVILPKQHKGDHHHRLYIEAVRGNGAAALFGPALRLRH